MIGITVCYAYHLEKTEGYRQCHPLRYVGNKAGNTHKLKAEKGLVVGVLQTSNPETYKGNTHARKELYAVRENT